MLLLLKRFCPNIYINTFHKPLNLPIARLPISRALKPNNTLTCVFPNKPRVKERRKKIAPAELESAYFAPFRGVEYYLFVCKTTHTTDLLPQLPPPPPRKNHAVQVLAVFPDTTSFYRATISKQPVRKGGMVGEVGLLSEWRVRCGLSVEFKSRPRAGFVCFFVDGVSALVASVVLVVLAVTPDL